ncbi:hypothetical protein Hamer_G021914 [Homarus americanus]|uniref:Uncharacterized protein n=1 Tax=Homarus americanus TaxID=6706 RepID=A0A8J5TLQ2_HOMAM|nr:hypothetical protein Hamer_G021914 [Homarus americanus]
MENVWTFADALELLYEEKVKVAPAQVATRESAMYVDSGGTGRPPVGTGTKDEGEEVYQGGPLSSLERVYRRDFESRGGGLHSPEGLVLKAANGGSIPYLGHMLVDVEILGHKIEQVGVLVRKEE